MRGFFRSASITLFILIFPITFLLALPRLNGYNTKVLEAELRKENVYPNLSSYLENLVAGANIQGFDLSKGLLTQVKAELTPVYVQGKSEASIDSSAAWITGRTTQTPTISFNDLKGSILAKNPTISSQLQQFQDQVKQLQAQGGSQLTDLLNQQNLGPSTKAQLQLALQQSSNLQSVSQGDYTFSLEQPLSGLKSLYHLYTIVLPVVAAVLVLLLILIVLLGTTTSSRLSGLGWTLAVAAVWNGLLVLIVHMLEGYIEQRVLTGANEIVVIGYHSFVNTIMANYVPIEVVVSGVVFAVGLALLITGRIIKQQVPPAAPLSPVSPEGTAASASLAGTTPTAATPVPKQSA